MKKRKKRSVPVIRHRGINIREVRHDYYMVDHQRAGKRERACFDDLDKAKLYCDILARKIENEGTAALSLTPAQRDDAAKALGILEGHATLEKAAAFWALHNRDQGATVAEVARNYLQHLRTVNARPSTLRDREHKLGRLEERFGDRPADALMPTDFEAWFNDLKLRGANRDSHRRVYQSAYKRGQKNRLCTMNPLEAIEPEKSDEVLPTPFTVKETRAILAAAEKYAPVMVPSLAVQFFAGLRPGESYGLVWQLVDFKGKTIRVMPEVSKRRRTRIVDMSPIMAAWLAPYAKDTGVVGATSINAASYYMHRKPCGKKTGLLAAAGIEWIQDGPRKTFASMHYATHQDAGKAMAILGQTGGVDVFYRHYRGLVTKAEAARYWKIRPADTGKVIKMGATA